MGYCDEHDKVYSGAECPTCTGETATSTDDHASEPSRGTNRTGDEPNGQSGDAIDQQVDEAISDALGTGADISSDDGDIVVGDQTKDVDHTEHVDIDNSETTETSETETHETTVRNEDTVMKDTDIGVEDTDSSSATGGSTGEADPATESVETEFCIHCGTDVPVTATTCPSCGERLD